MPALRVAMVALFENTSFCNRLIMPDAESPEMPQFKNRSRICGNRVA